MARYRSPYSSRQSSSRSVVPIIILSLFAVGVIAAGLFLLADRLGTPSIGSDPGPENGQVAVDDDDDGVEEEAQDPEDTPVPPDPADLETAREVADGWAQLWSNEDYRGLYELLTEDAKTWITRDEFVERYEGIAMELGQNEIDVQVTGGVEEALRFTLTVTRESSRVGEFQDEVTLPLTEESNGRPRVEWTPSVIVAGLEDGFIQWRPDIPQRGRILDRHGRPLAHLGQISKVGVIPGDIEDEEQMLSDLSELIGIAEDRIKARYESGEPGWFMPIKDYPADMGDELRDQLNDLPGVSIQQWPERVYPAGPAAAHVVGYLTEVSAEELPDLISEGFGPGDVIGRAGIEGWGDEYLSGKRGGRMVILNSDRSERETLVEVSSEPAADITLTIDIDLQRAAYEAIGDETGSIVVLDPQDGAVLAMVSNPTYDPNQFILGHTNETWEAVNDPENRPLENRTTTFSYPIGSVFKVVTMAAGMEHLDLGAQSTVQCPGEFTIEGADQVWRDWRPGGQGTLTLHNALVQSCNTVFYEIGAELDTQNQDWLPEAARGFGYGRATGLEELREVSGTLPDAEWKTSTVGDFWARGDAVNLSIGQGYFAATPLQVAVAYAAVANGGTLYAPYLVQEIVSLEGEVIYETEPEETGTLPFSDEIVSAIQSAMRDVTQAGNGTARDAFQGAPVASAGKTGTAESGQEEPHSWYAGFAPDDAPEMTMIAMAEYAGEGSQVAAPIAREVLDRWTEYNQSIGE